MQIIKIFSLVLVMVFSSLYSYYLGTEKTRFNIFISEVTYSNSLLSLYKNKRFDTLEKLVTADRDRAFIEIYKEDNSLVKFNILCKKSFLESIIDKKESNITLMDQEVVVGKKKLVKYCSENSF